MFGIQLGRRGQQTMAWPLAAWLTDSFHGTGNWDVTALLLAILSKQSIPPRPESTRDPACPLDATRHTLPLQQASDVTVSPCKFDNLKPHGGLAGRLGLCSGLGWPSLAGGRFLGGQRAAFSPLSPGGTRVLFGRAGGVSRAILGSPTGSLILSWRNTSLLPERSEMLSSLEPARHSKGSLCSWPARLMDA